MTKTSDELAMKYTKLVNLDLVDGGGSLEVYEAKK